MTLGALFGSDGQVKRTWALIGHHVAVPLEDGDHLVEWEMPHDDADAVAAIQERLMQVRTQEQIGTTIDPSLPRRHRLCRAHGTHDEAIEIMYHTGDQIMSRQRGAQTMPTTPHHTTTLEEAP